MTTIEDVAQEFSANLRDKIEGIPAVIGRADGGGLYTVMVSGRDNYVYVRLYGLVSQTIEAKNLKTQYIPNLGVFVRKNSDKEYEVLGVDPNIGGIYLGDMLAAANVPPQGELNTVILPDEQFKPLRCRPFSGMVGWIELGILGNAILGGATFDLSTILLASAEKAWVIVSLNPTTNAVTLSQGTVVHISAPLFPADALAVSYPAGDLRIWAYLLYGIDATIPTDAARSMSLRPYFEFGGGSMSTFDIGADTGTDETVDDGEVITFAGGAGLTTAVSATNTITTSYNITALTEETTLDEANDLFLMYDGGAATYKKIKGQNLPGGSGVFTPAGTIWLPDASPAAAGAADDEFADASGGVPTGWTEVDFDTTVTVAEQAYGLEITKATAAAHSVGGIYKAIPAGDYSIWTYVSLLVPSAGVGSGKAFRAGIALFEDATTDTADVVTFEINMNSAALAIQMVSLTAYNGTATDQGTVAATNRADMAAGVYLRLRQDSGAYVWEWSFDGFGFVYHSAYTPTFTPAHFGLFANNQNTGITAKAVFKFFRYDDIDIGQVPISGRRIDFYA